MRGLACVVVFGIGCTYKPPAKADAAVGVGDAATDAATAAHYHYVMDHENVPTNNTQARLFGLDLNGDGVVDNQLGMVFGTLAGMGFPVQAANSTAVDTGATIVLLDLATNDFATTTGAGFTTYLGTSPTPPACSSPADTTCRHQLTGTAAFLVTPQSPHDPALPGAAVNSIFALGPGHMSIQIAVVSPTAPIELDLIGAKAQLHNVTASAIASGILAGGVTQSDLNTKVLPAVQQSFPPIIVRDCCGSATSPGGATCNPNSNPPCGCVSGSTGASLLGLFDTSPRDCMVSLNEIQNNSLVMSLLSPDVTLEGQPCLSIGVGITAVGAVYTP